MNPHPSSKLLRSGASCWLPMLALGLVVSGCPNPELKELNPCLVSGVIENIEPESTNKVDMLFMIDNSHSMADLQVALERELGPLIRVLTSGQSGDELFTPATDLHLGVVTSDMGLVGVPDIPGCGTGGPSAEGRRTMREPTHPELGDDGRLITQTRDLPSKPGCQADYGPPPFLRFQADGDPNQIAADFGCIATIGIDGCGFEQQLEAVLKALAYPMLRADVLGTGPNYASNEPDAEEDVTFVSGVQNNQYAYDWGHGHGINQGFLRPDSLLAVIQVTDEEDCSSWNLEHFHRPSNLPPHVNPPVDNDPLNHRGELNLRCHYNPQNLYPVKRYINGLKALRPERENMVVFAAIVGVPQDLVAAQPEWSNDAQRENWYRMVLEDERMIERIDFTKPPGDMNLVASCRTAEQSTVGTDDDDTVGYAYPPRRIVETARGFGRNGVVQSICQASFEPALKEIIRVISAALGAVCLPRAIPPTADDTVNCNVVWEMPLASSDNPMAITDCRPDYLREPDDGTPLTTLAGRRRCIVDQLKVNRGVTPPAPEQGQGWYYDDFSDEVIANCKPSEQQRIAFTGGVNPQQGVIVRLECLNEQQTLTELEGTRPEGAPEVGSACQIDGDCGNTPVDGQALICHDSLKRCVVSCAQTAECPAGWICDTRYVDADPPIRAFCTNPTCGEN